MGCISKGTGFVFAGIAVEEAGKRIVTGEGDITKVMPIAFLSLICFLEPYVEAGLNLIFDKLEIGLDQILDNRRLSKKHNIKVKKK